MIACRSAERELTVAQITEAFTIPRLGTPVPLRNAFGIVAAVQRREVDERLTGS